MKFTATDFEEIVNRSNVFDALTFVSSLDDPDIQELNELKAVGNVVDLFDHYIETPQNQRSGFCFLQELLEMYEGMLDEPDYPCHSTLQDAINKLEELGITPPAPEVILEELEREMRQIIITALGNDPWFKKCVS